MKMDVKLIVILEFFHMTFGYFISVIFIFSLNLKSIMVRPAIVNLTGKILVTQLCAQLTMWASCAQSCGIRTTHLIVARGRHKKTKS